jgi:hypothetical protein
VEKIRRFERAPSALIDAPEDCCMRLPDFQAAPASDLLASFFSLTGDKRTGLSTEIVSNFVALHKKIVTVFSAASR